MQYFLIKSTFFIYILSMAKNVVSREQFDVSIGILCWGVATLHWVDPR